MMIDERAGCRSVERSQTFYCWDSFEEKAILSCSKNVHGELLIEMEDNVLYKQW